MFLGAETDRFLTERTAQKVFENARFKAGIKKEVAVHSLRHSFNKFSLEIPKYKRTIEIHGKKALIYERVNGRVLA